MNSIYNTSFPITECPYCGGSYFKVRQKISGYGEYYVNLADGEIDSTELHNDLSYKNTSKYAVCVDCGKKLFKIDDYLNVVKE